MISFSNKNPFSSEGDCRPPTAPPTRSRATRKTTRKTTTIPTTPLPELPEDQQKRNGARPGAEKKLSSVVIFYCIIRCFEAINNR